ncbi:MAG: hypothetical protein AAFQ91_02160, partial [Cyanobacteria bacterium J06621_15]
ITDFVIGEDSLVLSTGLNIQNITAIQGSSNSYNDTVIIHHDETLAILTGIEASSLSANDFA